MSKVFVRHHILNGGEVWLQRKRAFASMFFIDIWYDWYKLDTGLYRVDEKLNKLCAQVEKLLAERVIIERDLAGEKKDVAKCTTQTKGVGDPFLLDLKDLPKDLTSCSKVEQLWKKITHPRLSARPSQQGTADRQRSIQGQEGGRSVFLSEHLSQFKDTISDTTGADTIIPYRHGNGNKSNKGQKVNMKSGKRQPGESEEGHEDRRAAMADGSYDADTWELS